MEDFECRSFLKPIHVYISYRGGDDTRRFIQSLSAALEAQGFIIVGDDKSLEIPGRALSNHLRQAMRESWILILVLSKSYVSSSWCLEELSQVVGPLFLKEEPAWDLLNAAGFIPNRVERYERDLDQLIKTWWQHMKQPADLCGRSNNADRIIPVFYDVDSKSFAQHIQESFPGNLLEEAMQKVTNLSGLDLQYESRSQVIPKIVKEVKSKIDKLFFGFSNFVGMQSRVEEVEKILDLSSNDEVQALGICGTGGSGKSSIALFLYLKIFHFFNSFCFIPNVSRRLKHGDLSLQELIHRHLETEDFKIKFMHDLGQEFLACKSLRNHKFLIVLDGVDHVQDIEELKLIEKSNCFGRGSRIIITTRDEHVLKMSGVDEIYTPKLLSKDEGSIMFRSLAFPKDYPTSDFQEMIDKVLEYANGLPLAIEILGSFFFGKSMVEWRSFLDREEIIPPYEIVMVLRKSFDELDHISKEMFLDIACFFSGKSVDCVKEILNDCGFSADIGIQLLTQKSLITIANQRIQMLGMSLAMGREIVRQEYPNHPEKRSRLYLFNDFKYVMEKETNMVIENVEAIVLDLEEPQGVTLRIEALSDMINLRLLIFHNVHFSGTLDDLPRELQHVSWHQYPFTSLPSSFQSDTLVHLIMPDSNITEVWKGKMMLPKLRKMNLCGSKTLVKAPDFGGVPNLERLDLEGCTGLLELDPSIAELSKLKFLNLRNCINLISIPNRLFSPYSLEILNLAGCSEFAHCLNFSPLKSLTEVKLLSIWSNPFLESILYFLLYVLTKKLS